MIVIDLHADWLVDEGNRLKVGLLFKEAAVAGRACKMRDRPLPRPR